jgi:translation initiation factor IF-3
MQQGQPQYKTRINHFIKVPQVRVILPDDTNAGIMSTQEALKLAQEQGCDLIEINPRSLPPVCKIANYGKFKYEEKKRKSEERKKQTVQELKEIVIRPTTDTNDLEHKLKQVKEFLAEGNKCKLSCKYRGREISHSELGKEKLEYCLLQLKDLIADNSQISLEGKVMWVIVSPTKK